MENWTVAERPGYFGRHRDAKHAEYDQRYGVGNWRIVWKVGSNYFTFEEEVLLYEDAYFEYLRRHKGLKAALILGASDVYDDSLSNIESGLDYSKQETERTHIQDIALRRCVRRFGEHFRGEELIQIRDREGSHELSMLLSPGQVPFHLPHLIENPQLEGWWKPFSVESFHQSNKVLQIKAQV